MSLSGIQHGCKRIGFASTHRPPARVSHEYRGDERSRVSHDRAAGSGREDRVSHDLHYVDLIQRYPAVHLMADLCKRETQFRMKRSQLRIHSGHSLAPVYGWFGWLA
ncbi:hypothetical protein D3230_04530 [Leucobacter chromiireducens subsp. solipictus]|uniref:Uncharacterized protein n=1 Tax=Leucobacter chromiireducens subsp. solipictus TaxID=398235 RepID=A0ABS1SDE2_9MICO|nr:hypothetical protein [Leucobacter chromiireducens subsp. solipictus]